VILDRDGVERLYRAHGHVVLRRARLLLGSDADAQEVLHDVFAALLRSPESLRSVASTVSWLYGATTHRCLNVLRGRRAGASALERHLTPLAADPGCARADALAEVRTLLALLPGDEGAALVYHHLDGMTYDEIAEQLGCSRRKVGYLLERAQGIVERARAERTA
jgi:RNA polymerase sigma factor (sigma-70 family)